MAKQFTYKGKTIEELKQMSLDDFVKLLPSDQRRSFRRANFTEKYKKLMKKIEKNKGKDKPVRTHYRDIIITPEMVGAKLGIHNGKEWVVVQITEKMLGHRLGEFAITRKRVIHSGPGIGATRGTKFVSVK
ncbi:30S ribosomal protein S19 [Candidatus Micrarchaeota archaeon]|nr:MAG: 30S ribosomal protein S19 [Candidatus Micrarchaeota archaeon]